MTNLSLYCHGFVIFICYNEDEEGEYMAILEVKIYLRYMEMMKIRLLP